VYYPSKIPLEGLFMESRISPFISFKNAVILATIIMIISLFSAVFIENQELKLLVSDLLIPATGIGVAGILFYTAKLLKKFSRRYYIVWCFLAGALLAWAIGGVLWLFIETVLQQEAFPSIADLFYFLYYPLFFLAILNLPAKPLKREEWIDLGLDMSIVMLVAALIFWNFIISPTIMAGGSELITLILSVLYPVFDLLLIFTLLMIMYRRLEYSTPEPLILLTGSAAMMIISNSLFIYQSLDDVYVSGGILDVGWVVSILLAGLAGVLQLSKIYSGEIKEQDEDVQKTPRRLVKWSMYLPYIWMFIAYFLLIYSHYYPVMDHYLLLGGVIIITILAIIRLVRSLRENQELYDELQQAHDDLELKVQKRTRKLQKANKELQNEIKEREKAEEELNLKALLLDAATDSIMLHDLEGNPIYMNRTTYMSRGYTENELMNIKLQDFDVQDFEDQVKYRMKNLQDKGEAIFETANYRKNGSILPVEVHAQVIDFKGEKFILGVARDITERKKAEAELKEYQEHLEELVNERTIELENANKKLIKEINERKLVEKALKESESTYRAIFENTGTATMIINEDTTISLLNAESERLTGRSREEVVGKMHWTEFVHPDDLKKMESYHHLRRIDPEAAPKTYEARGIFKENKITYMIVTVDMIPGTHKSVASFLDITDLKEAEKQMKDSLAEKEALLREVHHRVKNNMQIIISLLHLQSYQVKDDYDRKIFRDSQDRVKTMAMVHEKLYASSDLARIDFTDYIRSLASELFASYKVGPNIKLEINGAEVLLDIFTAVPSGLIVNELLTNSIKHAFPDGKEGKIFIKLRKKSKTYHITLADDGVGLPDDIDFKNTKTFGLQLVNMLMDQLDGTIEINQKDGTEFKITFKELKYKDRI
jgi:PAS domain S-box-containing protein